MVLYTPFKTNRLQYITDFLSTYLGLSIDIVDNTKTFSSENGPKINYSHSRITSEEIFICPHGLLFEKGIKEQFVECVHTEEMVIFFKSEGDIPFDLLSAIFFLLSRYEEYLPHHKDEYGRFDHKCSLSFRKGFLHIPLVNIWLDHFTRILKHRFPYLPLKKRDFQFIPSYDIDIAWSYLNKGYLKTFAGLVKDAFSGNKNAVSERIKVLKRKKKDPFDSFDFMDNLHRRYQINPVYFFLFAKKKGKYDKNISPSDKAYRNLIKSTAERYATGIHPSWHSGDQPPALFAEINNLRNVINSPVIRSRQHYIRFRLPETYRYLIEAGVKEDYSMGYGSINGFRASVASPFYWYDLSEEKSTSLIIYPFCYMDANSFYEQHLNADQAYVELLYYFQTVYNVKGTLITIWHNSFLGDETSFKGWRNSYERFVRTISLTTTR